MLSLAVNCDWDLALSEVYGRTSLTILNAKYEHHPLHLVERVTGVSVSTSSLRNTY